MSETNFASTAPLQQPENKHKGNGRKNIVIGILAAALLGTWGYLLYDKNKSGEKITDQQTQISTLDSAKTAVQMEFDNALARLDSITGSNNNLHGLLTEKQEEIETKKSEIRKILNEKKASESQLAKARSMIADLNDKITGLEAEVVRLTGENRELNSANTVLKEEKSTLEKNLQTSAKEKEELSKTLDVGSTFTASNIQVVSVNEKKSGKEKSTSSANKVDKLLVSFDVENRIANSGPADLYLIVTSPQGKVITEEGSGTLNTRNDGDRAFTTKISTEYTQGERKNIQFPIRNNEFITGNYRVEIYHNGFKIGEAIRNLKKGGLFS